MQEGTEGLRERVVEGDAVLRKAGSNFVNGLEQLQDLRRVESSVAASCRVRTLYIIFLLCLKTCETSPTPKTSVMSWPEQIA